MNTQDLQREMIEMMNERERLGYTRGRGHDRGDNPGSDTRRRGHDRQDDPGSDTRGRGHDRGDDPGSDTHRQGRDHGDGPGSEGKDTELERPRKRRCDVKLCVQ